MLRVVCLFFIVCSFSCTKQATQLPEKDIGQIELTGFYSFVFNFKTVDTLGTFEVTLANATLHKGESVKKNPSHIELEEAQLTAYFKEKSQVVDSIVFQNPLSYRFEVFENEEFRTGVIRNKASSIMFRVNTTSVDEVQILKEDSIISTFKVP